MKIKFRRVVGAMLCVYLLTTAVLARELVPVGKVIGLELQDKRVVVAGFDEEHGAAAKAAGILSGDIIQKIDNIQITCAEDVRKAIRWCGGGGNLSGRKNRVDADQPGNYEERTEIGSVSTARDHRYRYGDLV